MRSEPLTLQHKELLDSRFRKLALNISEYTFANVYLFREIHQFEVVFDFDIFLKGKTRDGFTYLMPTSPIQGMDPQKLSAIMAGVDFLFPIPQEWLQHFNEKTISYTFNEGDSDYFYRIGKLQTYPGRHLAGRRNLAKQFSANYVAKALPLDKDTVADGLLILDKWHLHHKEDDQDDFGACREALQKMDILSLLGRIYYADEEPVAFALGEELNKHAFVIHFAKTDTSFKGVNQYMYQEFALQLDGRYLCIDLEQDLGEPNLHQAKQAYLPDHLVKKYRVKHV